MYQITQLQSLIHALVASMMRVNEMLPAEVKSHDAWNDLQRCLARVDSVAPKAVGESQLLQQSATVHAQVRGHIEEWCGGNECEPDAAQLDALVRASLEAIDEMLQRTLDNEPDAIGALREYRVRYTVRLSGEVTVRARGEFDAESKAEEEVENEQDWSDCDFEGVSIDEVDLD